MPYTVIVEHVSLEPGQVGTDRVEVGRWSFRDPNNAAAVLSSWIEAGQNALAIPLNRLGRFYILDDATGSGMQWALAPFVREHKLDARKFKVKG